MRAKLLFTVEFTWPTKEISSLNQFVHLVPCF